MIYLAFGMFGIISLNDIKINLLPNLEFPRVTIITGFANSAPSEIENLITKPITETISTINGLEKVESESIEGFSFITAQFNNTKNINFAIMELRERIDLIRDILPQDASKSVISRYDPSKSPIIEIVFFAKGLSNKKDLRSFVNDNIKIFLDRVDGVAAVQLSGGDTKEIVVEVDPQRMYSYNLSLLDIKKQLDLNNRNFPAGQLPVGNRELLIRAIGEYRYISDIGEITVGLGKQSEPVYLKDLSRTYETYKEKTGKAKYNGKDCVIAYIHKESSKNTVEITREVRQAISDLQKRFHKDVEINVVYEEAEFIQAAINNLFQNLLIGTFLAFLALLIILRNFKSPLILLFVIPATLLPAFIIFKILGISLNLMSLGGIALGIGMLFDNSNVVLSGIERNLLTKQDYTDAIISGSSEVAKSIFSATMTTVIVFLPISFIKSFLGIIFSEMALAIVVSLLISFTVALTLIPLLAFLFYKDRHKQKGKIEGVFNTLGNAETRMQDGYVKKLSFLISSPVPVFTVILVLFVASFLIMTQVKKEFVPSVDTSEFRIELKGPEGYTLESMEEIVSILENKLLSESIVKGIITNIGYDSDSVVGKSSKTSSTNVANIRVVLDKNKGTSTLTFINQFRKQLDFNKSISLGFFPGGDIISSLLSQNTGKLELLLIGDELEELKNIGKKIQGDLEKIEGIQDISSGMEARSKELKVSYDPLKLTRFNFSNSYVADYLKTATDGSIATKMKVAGYDVDIRLRFKKSKTDNLNKILQLKIQTKAEEPVEISQFATVREFDSLNVITRRGKSRVNVISIDYDKTKKASIEDSLDSLIANYSLPTGYTLKYSGEKENLNESVKELLFSFALASILIYMLLSAQFESLKYSLVMVCTIPLIFIGSFPALYFSGKSLNVSSFMGLILLVGVVVDNATLFYEYLQIYKEEGLALQVAILESSKTVLRPILMNNSTTILGLLPVVLGLGRGSEFQAPLGIVVVSGLISAAFFTLFLIPLLFYILENRKESRLERISDSN
ncbi:MAG: efflux RND transporter permease subunit [Leptospiraceae bacterium]|nr:efflux RND transporter permease subunit [Leptospiraceae bacterium]